MMMMGGAAQLSHHHIQAYGHMRTAQYKQPDGNGGHTAVHELVDSWGSRAYIHIALVSAFGRALCLCPAVFVLIVS